MHSKTTSFWMAVIVGTAILFLLQQYAPTQIKPLQNRLLEYPRSIPTALQINHRSARFQQTPSLRRPVAWQSFIEKYIQSPTIAAIGNRSSITIEGVDLRQVTKPSAPSTSTSIKKIQEDVYEEINGDEEFRYGYQVQSTQTYVDHSNGETCNDGGGTISGTYCAPNGERYNVNVTSTNQAAATFNQAIVDKINDLSTEEILDLAKNSDPSINSSCQDTACQQHTLEQSLNTVYSQALIAEKQSEVVNVTEAYLIDQKAEDYINLSSEDLKLKYGSTDIPTLLPTLSSSQIKDLEARREKQQAIIASAVTETTESTTNGKTTYTMTTTYTDPDTGEVIDTKVLSYTAETVSTKEKVDDGFITHDSTVFRDATTGELLDIQTTSYILKSSTRSYKTSGRSSGGTVEQVSITTTTATDANTGEVIQTTRTYAETTNNSPTLTLIQNTTTPMLDGSGKTSSTIKKSIVENPNYIPKTIPSPTNFTVFNKELGETCSLDTDCATGVCSRASVVAINGICQPNPNQNSPITASPDSCPTNTSLSCRGTACACLTQSQITDLEKLDLASSGNFPTLAATIPENYSYKNDTNAIGNYAGANGNLSLNKLLTYADTGWSVIPSWDRYKNSFSPDNVKRQWQAMNYSSLEDCQKNLPTTFQNGTINGPFLCNDVIYNQEQFISSVDLGTDLTSIGAAVTGIPGALKAGGNILLNASLNSAVTGVKYTLGQSAMTALQAALPTIGTFGAISTANQTGNTAVSCLDGSETCARDLGYTTLSWLNLGSMQYISNAMASGVASQIRNAQIVNSTLTVANAGTDLAIANESCLGENKTTAGCLASAGVIAFDIAGGFFDLKSGQFIFQKVPDLNINSAALASLANNPVPPPTKNALDPIIDNNAKAAVPAAPNITVLKNGDVNNPLIIRDVQIDGINTARIDTSAITDATLRSRAELTNALLNEFAADIGYQPYPAQVAELLSGKTVMQLKYPDGHTLAGQPIAGKTDIIARIASVGEPRSIVLTKGTTEAMDYINTQMLGPGGRSFYQSQGATGIFVHNELGFLEIDFTKGSFNPNTARVMSADEVSTLLKNNLDLADESRLIFVADRPQAAWTRLSDSSSGLVMKDLLTTNTYGSALIIADEISEDIKGVFAVSGAGIPLADVTDASLLGGVKSGDQAINLFKQAVDDSPTHQQFTNARNSELNTGVGVASSLQNLGDGNFIPVDKTIYGNTLADIVDQSLKKWSHRNSQLGKNLTDLLPALRSGDQSAIKSFEALLADAPPSSLLTDITFRKSSIQSDYNMLARVPGSDFGIEGNDLVLRKATATTGEKLSGPTDLLAFYYRGYDMTQAYNAHMIEKIDINKPITRVELADISISPQGSKISVTEFYQEMQTAGHKLMGLDATPQEAISALYLKDNPIETKITPAHLATDTNRSGLVDQFVDRRVGQFSNNASAVVLAKTNSDMNADLLSLVKKSHEKGVGYTEVIVAQYKKQPNGIEAEEYLAYPVKPNGEIDFENRRNLGDAQGWNAAIQSKLSGDKPQELLIVYMGRERAADLKVIPQKHDKIRWSLLFETSGGELPTEVSFEQMWRRNRIFNTDFSKSMDFDLYLTTTRTDLSPDNVQTAYFRENLNTKLANDRFTAALDDIAKSPVLALEQIKALKNDKMSFVAAVRFKNLIERLEQEVGTFENILRTGLSPDLLTGDDLYRELHLRASRSNTRILKMAEEAAQILGYSDAKLASLKNNLHASDAFPDWPVFKAELDTLTTEFSAPESYGPADLLMAYAKNNSTSAGSAPQFRATNERYIAPTTPNTATAPRSAPTNPDSSGPLDLNSYVTQTLVSNRNNFVAIPTLNGRPLNNLINQPSFTSLAFLLANDMAIAITREEDGQLYYSEDVNGRARQIKISDFNEVIKRLPNPASIVNIQLNEQDLARGSLNLNPTPTNSLTLTTQKMVGTLIETIAGTILPTSSTSVSNNQLVDINPNTVFKNPSIGDQSIENILSTDNTALTFTTFETEDGYVREFTVSGGQLYYSGNPETPRPIILEEALQLLPDPTDVAHIDLNGQDVSINTYTLPATSHTPRTSLSQDLSLSIATLINASRKLSIPTPVSSQVSSIGSRYTLNGQETLTSSTIASFEDIQESNILISTNNDPNFPVTLDIPPNVPMQTTLTINGITNQYRNWVTSDNTKILLKPNDIVQFGNHVVKVHPEFRRLGSTIIPEHNKDLQARLTYLEELRTWATSIDPETGPANRFNRAIRYATYKQSVKNFEKLIQQRYQDLDTLHKAIFNYISQHPDDREAILNYALEQAQKLSFTHAEINNILYAINGYILQHERVSELRTRYGDSKDKIKEMWQDAFGFEPQGEIQIYYSYNTINLIPNNLTDFGRAYHVGDTTTKNVEPTSADIDNVIKTVGGFHKNNGTRIANTENIFNVVRDDETLAEVITHEDQHGLFKNLEKVFLSSRNKATLATKQEALNIELTRRSGLLDISTTTYNNLAQVNSLNLTDTERLRIEKANLNKTAIYLTRVVNNDLEEIIFYDARPRPKLGILQSLNYAGTEGKVIVFRGKGIVDLSNKLIEYAYDERLDAETAVANEVLAQITGRVAIGVPLPDIKVEVAKSLRSHLYAYFVGADKSSTNFNTHEAQPEWNQFRRTITQRYYTTKAQQEIVDNALQAYETLILKGWSHASASFLLQATRLANWLSVANRAGVHIETNSTPSDIDYSLDFSIYPNSISNNIETFKVKNAHELRDIIDDRLNNNTIGITRKDGSIESYAAPLRSLTIQYFDAYGNTKFATYTSAPTLLADIIDKADITEIFSYKKRDIDLSHPIEVFYKLNGKDQHESVNVNDAWEIEPSINEFKDEILDSDPEIETKNLPIPLYIRFTNSLGLKEVYYPYGRTITTIVSDKTSSTTNNTSSLNSQTSTSQVIVTNQSPMSPSQAFSLHMSKWEEIDQTIIKPLQNEIRRPEILLGRQEKYLTDIFELITQMTKSPTKSTNNSILESLRELGYPNVVDFGEWIDLGGGISKPRGYDTSKPYWTDAAKWVAGKYGESLGGFASNDYLLEAKKNQLTQIELTRKQELEKLIEQFGQPMANLIRTYEDMQSRLPRLRSGQYSAVNEWRKKNAGKYFLLKRTYPKESLEGVSRARFGLDFRVDGLDPANTTLDEDSALFLSRWVQSHADEIDWWPIAVQHSTIPEKRPYFDPLISTTEQSTNQFAKFGDAEMHLRVPAEKLIPYSIIAQERINQLSREISSIRFSNDEARNSEEFKALNEERTRLLKNVSEYEFMVIGNIDMSEITSYTGGCSVCSVEAKKVADAGADAIRNQNIQAAREAINIANNHTYERPDLQHMVNAFTYAAMGIASNQKTFLNLALRELASAQEKFDFYVKSDQLLGGNSFIDLTSVNLSSIDPRLSDLLAKLPENGSLAALSPEQVKNTLQTARDYLKELGADTNNLSSLNPLMLQEITRRNVSRLLGDLKYFFGKNEENNIEESVDNYTQLGFRLDYPGSDALARLVDNTILFPKSLLSRVGINFNYESIYSTEPSVKTSAQRAILPLLSTGLTWSTNASISVQNTVLAALQIPVNPFFAFLPDLPLLIHQVNIWFSNLHLLKDLAVANMILPVRDATIYFIRNVNPNQAGFAGSAGMLRLPIFTRPLTPTTPSESTSLPATLGSSGRLLHPVAGLDDILPIEPVTSTKAGPHITMLRNLSRRPSSLGSELGYDFTLPATNLVITAHDKISDVLIPNQTGQSVITVNEGGAGIGGIRGQHSETITLKATNLPVDARFNSDGMDLGQATLMLKAQIDSIAYLANHIAREQMVTTQTYDPEGNPQYELSTVNSHLYPPSSRSIRFTYPVADSNNQNIPVWYFEDMTIQEASRLTQTQLLNLTKIMSGEFEPDDRYLKENSHRVVEEWFSYKSNKDDIPPIAAIGYAETNPSGNVSESHPIQMFDHRINIRFATYFTKTINKKMGPVTGMFANEIKLLSPHSLNGLPVKNTVNNLVNRLDFLGFDFETPKVQQLETVTIPFSSENSSFGALTNRTYIDETDHITNNQILPSANLLRLLNIYGVETNITLVPALQNLWQDVRTRLVNSENIKPPNLLPYLMSAANLYDRGNPTTIYHPVAISGLANTIQMAGVTQGMANAPLSRAVFGETTLSANDFQRELNFNSALLLEQSKNDPKDLGATTPDYFLHALKANAPGMQQLSAFILSDFAGTINAPIQVSYLQRLSEPGSTLPINISTFKTATTAQTRVGIGVIDNNISLVNTGDIYTLGKTITQMLTSTKYPAIRQYFVANLSPSFFKDTLNPKSLLYKRVMRILKGQEQISMDDPILKQTSNETNRQILIILGSSDPVATFQYLYATTYINLKEVEATKKVVEIFAQAIYNVLEEDSRYSSLMHDLYIQNAKIMSLEYIRNLYQTVLYFNHMASTPTAAADDLLLTLQAQQETEQQLTDIFRSQAESLHENR